MRVQMVSSFDRIKFQEKINKELESISEKWKVIDIKYNSIPSDMENSEHSIHYSAMIVYDEIK